MTLHHVIWHVNAVTCFFFFFLNQQFITQRMKADRGSYFRNYIHSTQTKHETKKKKRREMRKIRGLIKRKTEKKKEKYLRTT